jgi:hypothetical protein
VSAANTGGRRGKTLTPSIASLLSGLSISFATVGFAMAQAQPAPAFTPLPSTQQAAPNMTRALRCMDELFAARPSRRTITITSEGVRDETGKVMVGSKEILISALAKMTVKSKAFNFINYYIGNIASRPDSLEFRFHTSRKIEQPADSVEYLVISAYQLDHSTGSISIKTHLEEVATGKPILATISSNSILIPALAVQTESGQCPSGFDASPTKETPKPTRAMIEQSLLETLGKLVDAPFRQCLA